MPVLLQIIDGHNSFCGVAPPGIVMWRKGEEKEKAGEEEAQPGGKGICPSESLSDARCKELFGPVALSAATPITFIIPHVSFEL